MCKELPSVQISIGSPSLLKTATEPRSVMQITRRLSLVQAISATHQHLRYLRKVDSCNLLMLNQNINNRDGVVVMNTHLPPMYCSPGFIPGLEAIGG